MGIRTRDPSSSRWTPCQGATEIGLQLGLFQDSIWRKHSPRYTCQLILTQFKAICFIFSWKPQSKPQTFFMCRLEPNYCLLVKLNDTQVKLRCIFPVPTIHRQLWGLKSIMANGLFMYLFHLSLLVMTVAESKDVVNWYPSDENSEKCVHFFLETICGRPQHLAPFYTNIWGTLWRTAEPD